MAIAYIRPRIAVIELFGTIGGGVKTEQYGPIFDAVASDARFRAMVLDIDSPGGSVSASQYLYGSISKVARRKPVIAFIRGTGASGAYLACCGAHRVVALEGSLVGSIGVVSRYPILQELLQRVGVSVNVHKSGSLKDMGATYRAPTEEEEQKMQSLVDEFYDTFVATVSRAREMDEAKVREVATGEVFTAAKALELGLVDEIGDLDRALDLASELGRVARRPFHLRPRRTLRDMIFGRAAESLVSAIAEEVEQRLALHVTALMRRW